MITKKYYVIEFGGSATRIYTESRETAFEMFKVLDKVDFVMLNNVHNADYQKTFKYLSRDRWRMFPKTVDLFDSEKEAEMARDNYDKLEKMKLVKKKKI